MIELKLLIEPSGLKYTGLSNSKIIKLHLLVGTSIRAFVQRAVKVFGEQGAWCLITASATVEPCGLAVAPTRVGTI